MKTLAELKEYIINRNKLIHKFNIGDIVIIKRTNKKGVIAYCQYDDFKPCYTLYIPDAHPRGYYANGYYYDDELIKAEDDE